MVASFIFSNWSLANYNGIYNVCSNEIKSIPTRSNTAKDLYLDASCIYIFIGTILSRSRCLLGMEQYFVKFAAICNYEKNGSESRALVEYSEHIQEESKKEDPVISKSDFSLNELRAGEKLFARSSEFILSVVENNGFPDIALPEIAFAGRSNVGKSSLINSLVGMKKLARVSNTPGRTQTINFFNQNDALVLVDLPGFGYAKASKDDITRWKLLTFDYLRGRVNLECVFLLIDSRHGIKPIDIEVMNILDEAAVSYQIVLTKLDKVKKESLNSLCKNTNSIISKHGAARPFFHLTSSKDNIGLDLLRSTIFKLI